MDPLKDYFAKERGRMSALAKALALTPSAVHQWKETPAERVLEVERITGIPKSQLRPDLYPKRNYPANRKRRAA